MEIDEVNLTYLHECKFCEYAEVLTHEELLLPIVFVCRNKFCSHFAHLIVGDHDCHDWSPKK